VHLLVLLLCIWVVSFTTRSLYTRGKGRIVTLYRKLRRHYSLSGSFRNEKNIFPAQNRTKIFCEKSEESGLHRPINCRWRMQSHSVSGSALSPRYTVTQVQSINGNEDSIPQYSQHKCNAATTTHWPRHPAVLSRCLFDRNCMPAICYFKSSLFYLVAFASLREETISFVMSVCLSAWNNMAPMGRIFMKFYIWKCLEKSIEKINPLNAELNPICYLLALLGADHFLHVSRIRVKSLILRLLIYIYGEPILDVSRSHTTTQHSR